MSRSRRGPLYASILIAAGALLLPTAPARAQDEKAAAEPVGNRYLKLVRKREWTVRMQVTLEASREPHIVSYSNIDRFRYERLSMFMPLPPKTASSLPRPDSEEGTLFLDGVEGDQDPTVVGPFHSDTNYARYDAENGDTRVVRVVHKYDTISWDTVFDERAALEVPWPTGEWPDEAKSTFGPQQFINPAGVPDPPVADLVKAWTEGKDPRSVPPVTLAKWLAGRVQELVQLQGDGVNRAHYIGAGNATEGIELQGAAETAIEARGSRHDMALLLVAVYRAAGLPARLVIGADDNPESSSKEIRSWVEFCLYDEKNEIVAWIPVDVAELRSRSSRMQAMDRPWEYFGTNDELHEIAVIGCHFIPPAQVRAFNSPAFYGMRMSPLMPPYAKQLFNVDVYRTPKRGDDPD
ncbi:MAG: transglutaminase domain-containing protein [Phycisphaerales bacterium]